MDNELILILDNVRSLYNVGAIFRVAAGLGVGKVYLCGITPAPPRAEIHKTALGAETKIAWEYVDQINELIQKLKTDQFTIAALEITESSIPITDFKPVFPLALMVGHEREGVGNIGLSNADVHVHIPVTNHVHSLNVATATAIAVWHVQNN